MNKKFNSFPNPRTLREQIYSMAGRNYAFLTFTNTDFDAGWLLTSATLFKGTKTFVSGK